MYCNSCKKNVPDGKFCTLCGKEVIKNEKKSINKKRISIYSILLIIVECVCLVCSIIFPILAVKSISVNDTTGAVSGFPIIIGAIANSIYIPLTIGANIGIISVIEKHKSDSKKLILCLISILLNIIVLLFFHIINIGCMF